MSSVTYSKDQQQFDGRTLKDEDSGNVRRLQDAAKSHSTEWRNVLIALFSKKVRVVNCVDTRGPHSKMGIP